jgi:hypothetical protein
MGSNVIQVPVKKSGIFPASAHVEPNALVPLESADGAGFRSAA